MEIDTQSATLMELRAQQKRLEYISQQVQQLEHNLYDLSRDIDNEFVQVKKHIDNTYYDYRKRKQDKFISRLDKAYYFVISFIISMSVCGLIYWLIQ